jgi:hypothetical protein
MTYTNYQQYEEFSRLDGAGDSQAMATPWGWFVNKTSPVGAPHDYAHLGAVTACWGALSGRILFGGGFAHGVAMG